MDGHAIYVLYSNRLNDPCYSFTMQPLISYSVYDIPQALLTMSGLLHSEPLHRLRVRGPGGDWSIIVSEVCGLDFWQCYRDWGAKVFWGLGRLQGV